MQTNIRTLSRVFIGGVLGFACGLGAPAAWAETPAESAGGAPNAASTKPAGADASDEGKNEAKPAAAAEADEPDKAGNEPKPAPSKVSLTPGNRTEKWFKKGELASVGALGLVPWTNRVGGRLDVQRLGNFFYLAMTPIVNYTTELAERDLTLSFGVPLRIQLVDIRGATSDERFADAGRFRVEDWDSPQDYAKLIRFIKYGRKEDKFYVNINGFRTGTLGHGTILKRYNPNISIDIQRVSLELDGFTDWFGAQTYLNHIAPPNMAGALVFVKPLSLIDRDDYRLRSFSLGFTFVGDFDAPVANKLDTYDVDRDGRRGELLLGGQNGTVQYHSAPLLAYGIDLEMKVFKSEDKTVDLKLYADYSFLTGEIPESCDKWKDAPDKDRCETLFSDDPVTIAPGPDNVQTKSVTSGGLAIGLLGRFTLGEQRDHALRIRGEFRTYDGNYVPSYFDTLYQAQRVQYASSSDPLSVNPANMTKARRILGRDPSRVYGFYGELTYQWWETFEMGFGLGLNTRTNDNMLFVHLGVPKNKIFSFFISFVKSASSIDDLFTSDRNSVFLAQGRVFMLPFLHLYIGALTPFGFGENNSVEQLFDITAGLEISIDY